MGKLDFVYTTSGLEASFRVISKVPVKAILDWDFGDDKGEVFNGMLGITGITHIN